MNAKRALTAATIAVLISACQASVSPSQESAATPMSTAPAADAPPATVAPATSSPMTSVSGATDRVLVSGTMDCGIEFVSETTEGQLTTKQGTITCTYEMSDPRVSGTETGGLTIVYLKIPGLEIDRWSASQTLTGRGGTWRGSAWGSEYWDTDGLHTTGTASYVGQGVFEGLTYRTLFAQGIPGVDVYIVSGWIEPAG